MHRFTFASLEEANYKTYQNIVFTGPQKVAKESIFDGRITTGITKLEM
jgi:hypothetical protein